MTFFHHHFRVPYASNFFGDEIESLRTFDQETQRSLNPINECTIGPAREAIPVRGPEAAKDLEQLDSNILHKDAEERWKHDLEELRQKRSFPDIAFYIPYLHSQATILDYLPRNGLLILDNPASIQNHITDFDAQAQDMRERLEQERENPTHLVLHMLAGTHWKHKFISVASSVSPIFSRLPRAISMHVSTMAPNI